VASDVSTDERETPPREFSTRELLVKLVLLPALLVLATVLVISWATHRSDDVETLLERLRTPSRDRWRAAAELATLLRDPANEAMRSDEATARRVAEILAEKIDAAVMTDEAINLRFFLCRALGEFAVPDGLPVLVRAATTQRDAAEVPVRQAAIEAIAMLADKLGPESMRQRRGVMATLLEATEDPHESVRSAAAFALGVMGGNPAEARLAELLDDGYPDVRYNAALGLTRHGDPRCMDVLLEMLDPEQPMGVATEKHQVARDAKRRTILINALLGTQRLAETNTEVDLAPLADAAERLTQGEIDGAIRAKAAEVLKILESRADRGL